MGVKLVEATLFNDEPCAINPAHIPYLQHTHPDRVGVRLRNGETLWVRGGVDAFLAEMNGPDVATALAAYQAAQRDAESGIHRTGNAEAIAEWESLNG